MIVKNSNNKVKDNKGSVHIGDNKNFYEAHNKGIDIIAVLCPLILDEIYATTDNSDYSLTKVFQEEDKINSIDNKIIEYKESLRNFWRKNQRVEGVILAKNKSNPSYAGRIYSRFSDLYDDNKSQFIDKDNFGDLIINFIRDEIKKQIKDLHDLQDYPVSDLHQGIRFLTFHAFYKCKILENPNDSK